MEKKKRNNKTTVSASSSIDLLDCAVPNELDYRTNFQADILIMREISRLLFLERMKPMMAAVAQELVNSGVDFSNAEFPKEASNY